MENKQTPVEWLISQVNSDCLSSTYIEHNLCNDALANERNEMIELVGHVMENQGKYDSMTPEQVIKQYYNNQKK